MTISYSLTPSMVFLETIANGFTEAIGKKVSIANNALIFPRTLAEGKFEFHSLEPGLSIFLMDCHFFENVVLLRASSAINDFEVIHFNLSNKFLKLSAPARSKGGSPEQWENAIINTSSNQNMEISISNKGRVQMISLVFSKEWVINRFSFKEWDGGRLYSEYYKAVLPDNFAIPLNIELLKIVRTILFGCRPSYCSGLFYEGSAMRLMTMVFDTYLSTNTQTEKTNLNDIFAIMKAKEQIERKLDQPIPTVEEVAKNCHMNKSKFGVLFKSIYKKTYSDFFASVKMQKAASLILLGKTISEAGHSVGYANLGHFSSAFREYFKLNPKSYQTRTIQ